MVLSLVPIFHKHHTTTYVQRKSIVGMLICNIQVSIEPQKVMRLSAEMVPMSGRVYLSQDVGIFPPTNVSFTESQKAP